MNKSKGISAAVLLTLALSGPASWAQSTTTPPAAPAAASHAQKHEAHVEERIKSLHDQLKITDQQSTQWQAFEQTMRDNAEKTDQAFQDRAQKLGGLDADDAMKSYADLARMHADNMQQLSTSFSALYAVLSADQKATADKLFRHEEMKRHHHRHKAKAPAAATPPAPPPG